MRTRMTTWPPLALIAACALAGCGGGEPEPATPETPSPAGTQAEANTPAPPSTSEPATPNQPAPASAPTSVEVAGIAFDIPAGWRQEPVSSQMRAAQFRLGAQATGFGTLVFFGQEMGPVEDNIQRWISQVTNPLADPDRNTVTRGGLTFTTVVMSGTMQAAMGGPATPQPDWSLFGAIIEGGPSSTVYLKATGPSAALDRAAWDAVLESARVAE